MNARQVKEMAKEYGADLAGIASIERFKNLPPEMNPLAIKPDAKSVIVLGFSITRGALRGVENGMAWYTHAAGQPANQIIETTYLLSRALEMEGWEAAPMHAHSADMRHQGIKVRDDKPESDVIMDLDYAAHAAGLGEIGKGKFFLTKEFGPRQVFSAIITDLELEADPIGNTSLCRDCDACMRACPSQAYDQNHTNSSHLCSGAAKWHPIRIESCAVCKTGVQGKNYSSSSDPNRLGAACGRACIAALEDGGRLERKFAYKFRESHV